MQPNDMIRIGDVFWIVESVHLGALQQESVVEVRRVGESPASAYGRPVPSMVPELMLRTLIESGAATRYRRAEDGLRAATPEPEGGSR